MWNPDDDLEYDFVPSIDGFSIALDEYGKPEDDHSIGPVNHIQEPILSQQRLASHLRDFNSIQIQMGKLLTTKDILEMNNEHEGVAIETAAMLSNIVQDEMDVKCFSDKTKSKLKPIVYEKNYPIFLDKRFFTFPEEDKERNKKKTESNENESSTTNTLNEDSLSSFEESDSSSLNQSTSTINTSSTSSQSDSSTTIPYVAFHNTYQKSRYQQPTVGIDRQTSFVKPFEIFITKRVSKQKKHKKVQKTTSEKSTTQQKSSKI